MLKCEISEELMERVKKCEGKLLKNEYLNYEFKWRNCEMLWKEKDTCYNFGEFEIKNQDVTVLMKLFEDGHLYIEMIGSKNGWEIKEGEHEKLYAILDLCDSCYFGSPGIEVKKMKGSEQEKKYLNMSYCTARIKDDYCDAADFAMIAEETLMEFLNDVTTVHTEFFADPEQEKGQ
ncbi:MAG: hypothetical protein E7253_03580 [Lachnospiraceae bacterium]|nr:hypothetical protein [Lachnospiraceae bacterium]